MSGFAFLASIACAQSSDSTGTLERIPPEEAGFSVTKLALVEKFCELSGSAALLIVYDGKCVLSWGNVEKKYPVHSIRKALLNGLYGIYVDRGIIDTNATLAELGIDDIPPRLTESEKQATIADLLGSRSGVYHPAACEATSMVDCRPERGSHAPGTNFYYNNWDFNVLGTVFEQVTGENIFEVFFREIAMPLGMKQFTPSDGKRFQEENKSLHPAHYFWMTAHDMALYGLLYLNNGSWNGKRLISEDWIEKSTTFRSVYSQELGLGYGWLWLVLSEDAGVGKAFLHTGAGVHMLAVFKDLNLVFVHRVDTEKANSEITYSNDDLIYLFELILSAIEADKMSELEP
jgi:CubicO group peptidase (beta-lactamase class C family)